jgi:thiol-disulfide isomerase/thioredoxin
VVIGASGVRSLVAAAAFDARPPHSIPRRRPERLPQQLPVGVLAPQVQLPSLDGSEVDVSEFRGRMLVLLFWSPSCGYCAALRPDLVEWIRSERHVQLVGIASGGRVANEVQRLGAPILLEDDGATLAAFGASGTPSAVLIDAAGYVASPLAVGGEEVRAVLDRARALGSIASRSATNSARASRADGATEPSLASHRSPEARPSPPELAK